MGVLVYMNNKDNATWWNDKYPFLRVSDNSVYPWLTEEDSWADEIPIGWRDSFFENMCDDLISALGDYVDNFEIIQLKEKYGSMRLYWNWKDENIFTEEQIHNLTNTIRDVISKYETISYHTCVRCGKPSTGYTKPWILPVCEKCLPMC